MFKKISISLVSILTVVLMSSCSDDDSKIDIANLYGTWLLVQEDGYEDGEYFYETHGTSSNEDWYYLSIEPTGQFQELGYNHRRQEWDTSKPKNFAIDIENNTLYYDGELQEIIKLTAKELQLKSYWGNDNWMIVKYQKIGNPIPQF